MADDTMGKVDLDNSEDVYPRRRSSKYGDGIPVPGVTLRVIAMTALVALGGMIFGYDTGQISGFLEMNVFLERFGQKTSDTNKHPSGYRFSNVRAGLIVGLLSIGTLVGCLAAAPIANRIGRRSSIPPWCAVFCLGVTIQISVGSGGSTWVGIALGRFVAGFGVGALSVLVPMYMSESSPVPTRGAVISCYQLFITIGIWTADCINYGTESMSNSGSYRIPMAIGYLWALILGIGILALPESPRFDFNHERQDRGLITMSKFYGVAPTHPLIRREAAEIEQIMESTRGNHPWYETFTGPRMFYRIALGMTLQALQQLTGANYFFYYGTTIFRGVGIQNSYVTAIILGSVNVFCTFFGVYMARHLRRRECLYIAAGFQSLCFLIFASVGQFQFKDAAADSSKANTSGTVMIVFACLFIASFATTWGPLVWTVISEMFPYRYRALAMAMCTSANWFWNFMLAFFTPFITGDIDFAYGYVFAGCNLAAMVIVYFFLVESSGRTLEEVDAMYLLHVRPIGSANFVFDSSTRDMIGDGGVATDKMKLRSAGLGTEKEDEAQRPTVEQDEGSQTRNSTVPAGH